jgi:hypothetical protein
MKSNAMQTIEKQLPLLSANERLSLIALIAEEMRQGSSNREHRAALVAMANDPEIQAELRQIAADFSIADEDGLGDE